MPVYEYYCPKCSEVYELWQSMYDTDPRECPGCEIPMQKLISRSSFQLKGGGWYADGYCKKTDSQCPEKKPADASQCSKAGNNEKSSCAGCSQ